MLAFSSY